MNARGVLPRLRIVALSAIHRPGRNVIVWMLHRDVRMTTGARVRFVHRGHETLLVDEKGDCLSGGVGLVKGVIRMAIETGAVFDLWLNDG